ncbi:MAG: alpha/beta hydrolase [Myxococcales bacterium]|nr:alpha/beta hydrolase [Myxococcales bacterium]
MPWLFLAMAVIGVWFTFNAYLPARVRGSLTGPSFVAGWLTSELSSHHFAWQLIATVCFVWAGALEAWPGWLGLGITLASWIGLFGLTMISHHAAAAIELALEDGLGETYRDEIEPEVADTMQRPLPSGRRLVPFLLFDPEVKRHADIPYAPEHGFRGLLDVHVPKVGAHGAPVLFQIHGGAWVISQKRHQALPLMMQLSRAGWVCVSINYRLSPRATWPDHIIDVKRALAWVRNHIADYGGDPDFIVATGGSAGGQLSSLVGLTGNDVEWQPGFEDEDTRVQACVPFYGVYDFTNTHGRQLHDGLIEFLQKHVMKTSLETHRKEWEKASPLHRIHQNAPPFFIVQGTHDSLTPVEEARLFHRRLHATSQQPVCYAEIPGAQHAFEIFHSLRTTHVVRGVERFLGWAWSRELRRRAGGLQAPNASGSATTNITT